MLSTVQAKRSICLSKQSEEQQAGFVKLLTHILRDYPKRIAKGSKLSAKHVDIERIRGLSSELAKKPVDDRLFLQE
eukprot:5269940-Amphidinium_carterae.1